jgi:hypothetical protein
MTSSGDGPGPADFTQAALTELAARYTALRLEANAVDTQDGPPAEVARRTLEQLAVGTAIAQHVSAGWALDAAAALRAGASWEQIARARGQHDPERTRAEFAAWVRGQARLHRATGLGLDDRQACSAWRLLHPPADRSDPEPRGIDGPQL